MKFTLCFLIALLPGQAAVTSFSADKADSGSWNKILGAVGISESKQAQASIVVAGETAGADVARLAGDHILILIGNSAAAAQLGVQSTAVALNIRHICDTHAPQMEIIWEQPAATHITTVPSDFKIFATEKWKGSPVLAGKKTAHGAILWLATSPGPSGIERYPYLIQALSDLGLQLPAETTNLWAFFDSSYRIRADVDYLAAAGARPVSACFTLPPGTMSTPIRFKTLF